MTEHCHDLAGIVYNIYVYPAITGLAAVSILCVMYVYIKARKKGRLQSPKELYIAGIVFFTMVFLFYLTQINKSIFWCRQSIFSSLSRALDVQIYIFQILILLGILFYRVFVVFRNTVFALSNATTKFFAVVYVFTWIDLILFGIMSAVFWLTDVWLISSTAYVIVATMGSFCIFVLNVLLIWLFVYKLVQAFKSLSANRDEMLHLITKTSLLFFVSMFTLLLFVISPPLRNLRSVHWDFVCNLILVADVYTNFLCIFLSYQFTDNYYDNMCGCCHRKCHGFCIKCVGKEKSASTSRPGLEKIASNASQSVQRSVSPPSTETMEI